MAIEVLLVTACIANSPSRPLGPARWRQQQLAARGYKVVVVKEADWLEVEPDMRQIYLQMLFRGAGVVLPAK